MRTRTVNAALLLTAMIFGGGCGKYKNVPISEPEPWRTEEGANSLRFELIDTMIKSDSWPQALSLIGVLRAEGCESPILDLYQGQILMHEGMYVEAERLLHIAKKGMKRDGRPSASLGLLFAEQQRTDDAISSLQDAVELDPSDHSSWNNLGFLQFAAGKCDTAVESLREATRLSGGDPLYRNNLGFAYVCQGENLEALRAFRTTQPEDEARYNLGVALEREGLSKEALTQYRKALDINPKHDHAEDAFQRLVANGGEEPASSLQTSPPSMEEP